METRTSSKLFSRLTDLPTLPAVVAKLLQLPEDADFGDFAKLIGTDPGLTAKVLKLVNSAFYSLKAPVSDLAHGCSLIGVRTIKSIVLSVSVMQMFKRKCRGFEPSEFWRQSLATALVSRRIARAVNASDDAMEEVYLSGLLHTSGIPLFVQHYPEDYERVLEQAAEGEGELLGLEYDVFGIPHPEAGSKLAGHWRLSPSVSTSVRYHRTDVSALPQELDEEARQKIDVVRLADYWTKRAGFFFTETDAIEFETAPVVPIPEWMGVSEEELEEAIGDVKTAVAEVESLLR